MKKLLISIAALTISGCASITNGTKQEISFDVPKHQVCSVHQGQTFIGSVQESDSKMTVSRDNEAITLDCGSKRVLYKPSVNSAGMTSIIFIDFGLVDYATGALWEYSISDEVEQK